jgi:hypothetical protein
VLRARDDPRVLAALAELFRRNRVAPGGMGPTDDPVRARALAREALTALLRPEAARLADVGGLRLHLTVPSALYPSPPVIHASAWDEDAGVWRLVGEIVLEEPRP